MNELFVDKFHKMEEDFGLFDLKESNLPIWDVIRYDIYYKYYWTETKISQNIQPQKRLIDYFKVLFDFIFTLFYFLINRSDNLILPCSRYKNSDNKYFDKASQNLIKSLDSKFILETQSIYLKYLNKSATNYLMLYKSLNKRKQGVSEENISVVFNALQNTFKENRIEEAFIISIFNNFIVEYNYYRLLFRIKKCFKRVFFVQNGQQKGLIAAAKASGVSIIELQHGSFEKDHLGYSYPKSINISNNILMPDRFCKLGDYWGRNMNIPIKNIITTGNDYFVIKNIEIKSNFILLISSRIHQKELLPLTKELSLKFPHKKIIFKLHSNEFSTKVDCENYLKECINVDVVSTEYQISELIAECEFVVAINSTVVYEALSLNKIVFIYKRINYESFLTNEKIENLYLIDSVFEIDSSFVPKFITAQTDLYFQKFIYEKIDL